MAGVIKRIRKIIIIIIIFLGIIATVYGFIEPKLLHVASTDIFDKDIPPSFNDMRIVFVSDIHHGPFFSIGQVRDLVNRINSLNPDIILLGGDYAYHGLKYFEPAFAELKNLKAPSGKYGVLGNHDHWEISWMTGIMNNAGIELLENRAIWINRGDERIKLGGIADMYNDIKDVTPTINDVKDSDFVMLLSHNPDFAEQIRSKEIDLALSGHAHGGQVTFFGLWAPFIPSCYGQKYRSGIIETKYTKVLVTKGVGTVYMPIRFFAQPEIVLIQLKSQ